MNLVDVQIIIDLIIGNRSMAHTLNRTIDLDNFEAEVEERITSFLDIWTKNRGTVESVRVGPRYNLQYEDKDGKWIVKMNLKRKVA